MGFWDRKYDQIQGASDRAVRTMTRSELTLASLSGALVVSVVCYLLGYPKETTLTGAAISAIGIPFALSILLNSRAQYERAQPIADHLLDRDERIQRRDAAE